MEKVNELVKEIRENLSQRSSSQKDEVRVMRAMLNDREYEVGVYTNEGKVGTYCPAEDARKMISSVIASAASMKQEEAQHLAENYEFKKQEAASMVGISKEFVNTYLQTGRKLPLGGRETSNVSLCSKHVNETVKKCPNRICEDGASKTIEVTIKEHDSVKVIGGCPAWLK